MSAIELKSEAPYGVSFYDRIFYSGMAIIMAVVVLVGFAPTYYLRALSPGTAGATISGASLTPLIHLHAALFSGWVLLFVVQTTLIASRRVRAHRLLGTAGAVVAGLMVVAGFSTAVASARAGAAPPGVDPLVFLVIPLFDIVLFAGFVGAALWLRRRKESHKRLMMLAYITIITAAVARLPGVLPLGPLAFYGLTFIFLLAAVLYDFTTRRKVHPVYKWGGALLVLSVPGRLALSTTGAWRTVAEFLTS
ncbi:MAG: hypothetical protein KY459_04480 [Acidobacteria bacterium]|nr:hypothetical protein [Acidobacteriota bacterium]